MARARNNRNKQRQPGGIKSADTILEQSRTAQKHTGHIGQRWNKQTDALGRQKTKEPSIAPEHVLLIKELYPKLPGAVYCPRQTERLHTSKGYRAYATHKHSFLT